MNRKPLQALVMLFALVAFTGCRPEIDIEPTSSAPEPYQVSASWIRITEGTALTVQIYVNEELPEEEDVSSLQVFVHNPDVLLASESREREVYGDEAPLGAFVLAAGAVGQTMLDVLVDHELELRVPVQIVPQNP